jgi:hypothetical protein
MSENLTREDSKWHAEEDRSIRSELNCMKYQSRSLMYYGVMLVLFPLTAHYIFPKTSSTATCISIYVGTIFGMNGIHCSGQVYMLKERYEDGLDKKTDSMEQVLILGKRIVNSEIMAAVLFILFTFEGLHRIITRN